MKGLKIWAGALSIALVFAGCGSMSNTGKGALIGTAAGGAAGTGIGALIGKLTGNTKMGTAIGAAAGTVAGVTAGTLIGKKMDKAKKAAEAIQNAQVESVELNGLEAVKVTFEGGILFKTSDATLSDQAKTSLTQLAGVLTEYNDADVSILGHTDNTGWKNSTAAQSAEKNKTLSLQRAQSVQTHLLSQGVNSIQIRSVEGLGQDYPVADNSTAAGQAQNRRVEVYLYPSKAMIEAANNGTLQ